MAKKKKAQAKEPQPNDTSSETLTIPDASSQPEPILPIVGIGASAGGLKAFEAFFANIPSDTGMAFVLIQHLDAPHKSILNEIVARYTEMAVHQVEDGMEIEPNTIYVIPPNRDMALIHGTLQLLEPVTRRGFRLPIDYFFRSLAEDQGERAIGIVLSGTGTDGTLGLKAIKGAEGLAIVQDPESAQYDGMPRSAIGTGLIDYILTPEAMPAQLMAYVQQALNQTIEPQNVPLSQPPDTLQKIFVLLRAQTGHDFSYYKRNTIRRRIERRMTVNQIDRLDQYIRYLQQNPLEVEVLFKELLISVTNFFRDPDAFAVLEDLVIPQLFESKEPDQPIRIWVPGCASGEEAYSIAILIQEYLEQRKQSFTVQIFATDIDSEAIEQARTGIYPAGIAADVSQERLARFFAQHNNSYQIQKTIRDMVVFALQNVFQDPPFSKLDLISCRNLLIYTQPELQKKVLPLFHYALNPNGFLLLGSSESIGEFTDLFISLDRKWKLFQRQSVIRPRAALFDFPTSYLIDRESDVQPVRVKSGDTEISPRQLAEQTLLASYTPACAVINERGEILYIHGRTGKYLEPAVGEASLNILRMARVGLRLELTNAIRKVIAQKEEVLYRGLSVKTNGETQTVNLIVRPMQTPTSVKGLLMVLFEDVVPEHPSETDVEEGEPLADKDQRIVALERELRAKEEYLQTTIEELETANEELKSTNEELQSSNEELQSTNEELETSKEELQSLNEELTTVNSELQQKVSELSRAYNDMNNLLASTGIGTVFVDNQLLIQRFTPKATEIINLIETDIGRPISHIVSNLTDGDLVQSVETVLRTLTSEEIEVQSTEGDWYLMRIMPYRTAENVIEGAVITFIEMTELKQAQEELRELTAGSGEDVRK